MRLRDALYTFKSRDYLAPGESREVVEEVQYTFSPDEFIVDVASAPHFAAKMVIGGVEAAPGKCDFPTLQPGAQIKVLATNTSQESRRFSARVSGREMR